MDKTTLYLDHDIKCTYYPATQNILVKDELTGEVVALNFTNWQKVFAWLHALNKKRGGVHCGNDTATD